MKTRAHHFGEERPLLLLSHPADRLAQSFRAFAEKQGLSVWQPRRIDDFGWSFGIDGGERSLTFTRFDTGQSFTSSELLGIFCHGQPPLDPARTEDGADRRYAMIEYSNALWPIWENASCPVVGQPPPTSTPLLFNFGVEARIEMRRLGLPAAPDTLVSFERLAARADIDPARTRLTRSGRYSSVLARHALSGELPFSEPAMLGSEMVVATPLGDSDPRMVLSFGGDAFTLAPRDDGPPTVENAPEPEVLALVQRVRERLPTPLFLMSAVRGQAGWVITKLSLQLPFWMVDLVADWLHPRLYGHFTGEVLS
ncbi:MAG: hypothetical protein R3B70_03875 [Polyangiaceae bacterium]